MQVISVGDLKARFSEILNQVKKGQEIVISFGKQRKKVAVLMPYSQLKHRPQRKLGLLKGRASYRIRDDFKLSDEEILAS
jgi:prevent-host-death family protein